MVMPLPEFKPVRAASLTAGADMAANILEAERWLQEVADAFGSLCLHRIGQCFHEDVEVHYNLMPAVLGRQAVCSFLSTRYASMRNYHLHKTLRFVQGDTLGVEVQFAYIDANDGQAKAGKGFEYLTRREGRIVRWEYVCVTAFASALGRHARHDLVTEAP